MLVRPRLYPHPVLSPFGDDITDAEFQSTLVIAGTKTSYVVKVTARTSNKDLRSVIAERKARYAVHLECAATRYRALFDSDQERFEFEIPASVIDGRVEVCSFILSTRKLSYTNSRFHADYQGRAFPVHPGDVLAVGVDQSFIAEKKVDPLRQIPSIFVVVQNDAPDAPAMDIDTSGHKITVSLPKESFETYKFLLQAQPLHASLNSMIIIPALISTLEELRHAAGEGPDALLEYEGRRWYATLRRRLKELNIDPSDPDAFKESSAALAQRLIGEPLEPALANLRAYEEGDEEE